MDIYASATIAGVPLTVLVFGLVAWAKSFGLAGNWLRLASMLIGLIAGSCFILATAGVPIDFAGWFSMIAYGLGLGIVASGVYDGLKAIAAK